MYTPELAQNYQAKSDEELLQLASDSEFLTPDAQTALKSELARRSIAKADPSGNNDQTRCSSACPTSFVRGTSTPGVFLEDVLRVYHRQFALFLKLATPAVLVGYFAIQLGGREARDIAQHSASNPGVLGYRLLLVEAGLIRLASYLVSWLCFCLSFAVICSATAQVVTGAIPSVAGSLASLRGRTTLLLRLSLLLFGLSLAMVLVAMLAFLTTLWASQRYHLHLTQLATQLVSFTFIGLGLLALCRFGLAIPALVLNRNKVGQAMFRSDELTEGKWLTLAVLLIKSLVGGYVAGMIPFWLASWILPNAGLPSWFSQVLVLPSLAGVTIVEPVMFIGFGLMYLRGSISASLPGEVQTCELA